MAIRPEWGIVLVALSACDNRSGHSKAGRGVAGDRAVSVERVHESTPRIVNKESVERESSGATFDIQRLIKHDIGAVYREQEGVFFRVPITINTHKLASLLGVTSSCGCTSVRLFIPELGHLSLSDLPVALVPGAKVIVEASTLVPPAGDVHGTITLVRDDAPTVIEYSASVDSMFLVGPRDVPFGNLTAEEYLEAQRVVTVSTVNHARFTLSPRFSRDWNIRVFAEAESHEKWRVEIAPARRKSGVFSERVMLDTDLGVPVPIYVFGNVESQVSIESGRALFLGRIPKGGGKWKIVVRDSGGSAPLLARWSWNSETEWGGIVTVSEESRALGRTVLAVTVTKAIGGEDRRIRGELVLQISGSEFRECKVALVGWDAGGR